MPKWSAATQERGLVDWIQSHIGPGKKFRDPTEWSRHIGRSVNYVNQVIKAGRASPEGVIELADSIGPGERVKAFIAAGWLRPRDLDGELTPTEQELIALFRDADETTQQWMLRSVRGLHRQAQEERQRRGVKRRPQQDGGFGV